jgi:hypothetical protein
MSTSYPRLVCEGNEWIERGMPVRALKLYIRAAELPFFEGPNFLIYYRIAHAQSLAGDSAAAIRTLLHFEDMLALYIGEKLCSAGTVSPKAITVMCSEAFNPDGYAEKFGKRQRMETVKAYRERIANLRKNLPLSNR